MQEYKLQVTSEPAASRLTAALQSVGARAVQLGSAVLMSCQDSQHYDVVSVWYGKAYTDGLTDYDRRILCNTSQI